MKKIILLTLVAITLPFLLFAFVGCMKKPEIKADYGPEVALADIRKAANDIAPTDIYTIKKGQYISIDESQGIDVQVPITHTQRLDEVTDYQTGTDGNGKPAIQLTFRVTTNELKDGKWNQSIQDNLNIVFPSKLTSMVSKNLSASGTIQASGKPPIRETYHNLSKEMGVIPVPAAVAKQADCGGLPDVACKNGLRYVQIKFDLVQWDSEDHGTKTAFTFIYSADIPTYINDWSNMNALEVTNQLKSCAQTWVEIPTGDGNKQTVPVLNCAEVRDFHFGQTTP